MSVLSSRADTVSDGSALVKVSVPDGANIADAKVTLGSTDVTRQFERTNTTTMVGVITGLQAGQNDLAANAGGASTGLKLTNSTKNGPIFSGPQQATWLCRTADIVLPDGSSLGAATDSNCNAPTKVLFLYMPSGASAFKVLPTSADLPADLSKTTTSDGRLVNYIVRLETGTLNRAIYQIAVLFDPQKDKAPNPSGVFTAWNGKLIYTYGGGVGPGYNQSTSTGGVLNGFMLAKGYAVASSSVNVGGNYFNDVYSAEATSMVKERFIEEFGLPIYTMGFGGSGGSMQQYLIANNYPGLLDGINPSLSFPDLFTVVPPTHDCALLDRTFAGSSLTWTEDQKTAVAGFASWKNCNNGKGSSFASDFVNSYTWLAAKRVAPQPTLPNCALAIPDALIYDPVTNPTGVRCNIYDGQKTLLGVDPATGFAKRPWDNVGVQYGLKALNSGKISLDQFIDLNERVGGYDNDGNFQSPRSTANTDALNASYAYGRVNQMQNMAGVPIIDYRAYSETDPNVHDLVRSFMSRNRLIRANGSASNQIIWRAPESAPSPGPSPPQPVVDQVIATMDQWLMNIKRDTQPGTAAEKATRNKPSGLTDGCFDTTGKFISETADVNNSGQCGGMYPVHSDPRLVAGAPLTGDVLKCQLRAIQRNDYSGASDAQYARLNAVFSSGVCDFTKPSVGAAPLLSPWLTYTAPGVAKPL